MANNPNEISPEEGEAIKKYIEENGIMSGCKNLFTSEGALPISDVGETLIEENRIKCITFDKDAQDAIPKQVRQRMDKDRLKAKEDLERKKEAAFEIMAGGIMYKPKGCKMDGDKKRYKNGCGNCGTGNYKECAWD